MGKEPSIYEVLMIRIVRPISAAVIAFVVAGCAPSLNHSAVQARSEAPLAADVPVSSIPYDAGRPTALVVVEPLASPFVPAELSRDLTVRVDNERANVSQKLVSTLTQTGNVTVVDARALRAESDGTYRLRLGDRERGPFLVRAVVTEFSERSTASDGSYDVSLGWIGAAAGLAGLFTGKPGLGWSGLGVALADPTFSNETLQRTGVVAFDVQIVDGRTLRVVDAFRSTGTFSARSDAKSFSLFGYSNRRNEFAQSVLGQAAQAAINDAAARIRAAVI
jgi:curli biogenesis system outer membrane secretion channel CsgG